MKKYVFTSIFILLAILIWSIQNKFTNQADITYSKNQKLMNYSILTSKGNPQLIQCLKSALENYTNAWNSSCKNLNLSDGCKIIDGRGNDYEKLGNTMNENLLKDKEKCENLYSMPIAISAHPTVCENLTNSQAEGITIHLPEVVSFMHQMELQNEKTFILAKKVTEKAEWNVQVGEDHETHNTTFNWYTIDGCTGKVKCSMFTNGKSNSNYPCE